MKLLYLVSHPIQYLSPFFKEMCAEPEINLYVLYCSKEGVEEFTDPGFGQNLKWDVSLLEGYRYEFLKNYSPCPTVSKAPFGLMNFGVIAKILKGDFDAIVVHGWHYVTHLLAILTVVFFSKARLFLRCENPLNQELLKFAWKRNVKKIFFQLIKHKTFFLAIGTENKAFYEWMGIPKDRIVTVPYCVDNERWISSYINLKDKKSELRERLNIPKDKVVILFSGKLMAKKRPFDLLKAFARIPSQDKCLVYVGDGELSKMLREYADKNGICSVVFAGFKNQTEIAEYYAIADFLVLPSGVGETWGLVINEAMCFHLPIIVSDMPGAGKDLVSDSFNGFIYSVENIDQLCEKLELLITDSGLREKMGSHSFDRISGWNYQKGVAVFSSFFKQILEKGKQ